MCFILPSLNQNNKSTTTTKTPVSLTSYTTEIRNQSARIKSKALGFFANLGWTNLGVDKTNIEPDCGEKYLTPNVGEGMAKFDHYIS